MTDSYLELATTVLRATQRPLTAKQIMAYSRQKNLMPAHLRGKTQFKTLNARISEHIRLCHSQSRPPLIYRVAPATYFLAELRDKADLPERLKKPFQGRLRHKQVRHENVLVCSATTLQRVGIAGLIPWGSGGLESRLREQLFFLERKQATKRDDIKQFITYTMLLRNSSILSYSRGSYTTVSSDLKGARSIGFGGHINEMDFDLFSDLQGSLLNSVARELYEELNVRDIVTGERDICRRNVRFVGMINIDTTPDARKHVAVVSVYRPKFDSTIEAQELSLNQVKWLDLRNGAINLAEFEPWSQILLGAIQEGTLRIDHLFRGVNW